MLPTVLCLEGIVEGGGGLGNGDLCVPEVINDHFNIKHKALVTLKFAYNSCTEVPLKYQMALWQML